MLRCAKLNQPANTDTRKNQHTVSNVMPNLNVVICPGCASQVALENRGCPDCGYENNEDGRLLTIAEILERPSYPAPGAMRLNDVSPAFVQAVVSAAASNPELELSGMGELANVSNNEGEAVKQSVKAAEVVKIVGGVWVVLLVLWSALVSIYDLLQSGQ